MQHFIQNVAFLIIDINYTIYADLYIKSFICQFRIILSARYSIAKPPFPRQLTTTKKSAHNPLLHTQAM